MTKTAHTPGPWQAETIPSAALPNERPWIGRLEEHRYAALVCGDTQPEAIANAARIVACVNACEGIANPDVVPEAIDAAKAFAAKANGYDGIPAPKYFGDIDCDMRHPDTVEITFTLGQVRQLRAILAKLEGRS